MTSSSMACTTTLPRRASQLILEPESANTIIIVIITNITSFVYYAGVE